MPLGWPARKWRRPERAVRLIIDVNLPVALARCLREAGHDTLHLFERGQERLPDPDIFAVAGGKARVIVTCDLDFGALNALSRAG